MNIRGPKIDPCGTVGTFLTYKSDNEDNNACPTADVAEYVNL